jgi:protein gp37
MTDQRNGGIEWTDQTWNPIRGCSKVSQGCKHCYAETMAARFSSSVIESSTQYLASRIGRTGCPSQGLARTSPQAAR